VVLGLGGVAGTGGQRKGLERAWVEHDHTVLGPGRGARQPSSRISGGAGVVDEERERARRRRLGWLCLCLLCRGCWLLFYLGALWIAGETKEFKGSVPKE